MNNFTHRLRISAEWVLYVGFVLMVISFFFSIAGVNAFSSVVIILFVGFRLIAGARVYPDMAWHNKDWLEKLFLFSIIAYVVAAVLSLLPNHYESVQFGKDIAGVRRFVLVYATIFLFYRMNRWQRIGLLSAVLLAGMAISIHEILPTLKLSGYHLMVYRAHGFSVATLLSNIMVLPFMTAAVSLLFIDKIKSPWRYFVLVSGLIALIASGYCIFLTQTRATWIALVLVIPFLGFVRGIKIGLISALIFAVLLSLLIITQHEKATGRLKHLTMDSASVSYRIKTLKAHWKIFVTHPWLGVGYRNPSKLMHQFVEAPSGRKLKLHAHNNFAEVLAAMGVAGIIPFLIFHACFLIMGFKALFHFTRRQSSAFTALSLYAAFSSILVLTIAGLTDLTFHRSIIQGLFLTLIGVVAYAYGQSRLIKDVL